MHVRASNYTLLLLTACLAATAGCGLVVSGSDGEGTDSPPIQTNGTRYVLQQDGHWLRTEIPYVYTNRSGETVYVSNCRGEFLLGLERKEADKWVGAYYPGRRDCESQPIVIAPGDEYADTLAVYAAPHRSNSYPQFDRIDASGTYRIAWGDDARSSWQDEYPFGETLPLQNRISNLFQLEVE